MTLFVCRTCGRPCANGTGLAAHERSHGRQPSAPIRRHRSDGWVHIDRPDQPITTATIDGRRAHTPCRTEYPLGGLRDHLHACPSSATFALRLERAA
jgi:hypothetical protein